MTNHILSLDTQATLLLCASFGQKRTVEPQPLTLGEYNDLANWLKDNDLTPKDLLDSTIQNNLSKLVINKLESHRILALLERGVMLSLAVEQWTNQGLWILGRGDTEYPKCLKQKLRYQAPAIIYGIGNKELLSQGGLAVVGSRDADDTGLKYTQKLAHTCAHQGIPVISGSAKGIDQTAMLNTLDAGGTVVGVLADSLAKAAVAKKYRNSIKDGRLTLISTYNPNTGFNVGNAMRRNKYIYALADYSLVVSSSVNTGGTWAGAIEALTKIKDVPVLVRIEENVPKGNHELIKKGAIPFPVTPWNNSLKELIIERITNFKNKQENDIFFEQLLIPNQIDISHPNIKSAVNNPDLNSQISIVTTLNQEIKNKNNSFTENYFLANKNTNDTKKSLVQTNYNPQDIYEAVLPFILQNLRQPKDEKSLAACLDVQVGQIRVWLKRAVDEGKIKKNKKPVSYEIN